MRTIKKILTGVALAWAALSPTIACINGCGADYSDGERSGTVTKFSRKGLWMKSWEGELLMGGMTTDGDGRSVPNVFQFTVVDSAVVPLVQAAQHAGRPVTVAYRQWAISPVGQDSSYEIVSVK